jgi:serine phosphatase RsbU (regulator of sigma subunit)
MTRLLDQIGQPGAMPTPGAGTLSKIRALVEVARAVQNALSLEDVLASVVDAALSITGTERGFLLLKSGDDLEVGAARSKGGASLGKDDLTVPTRLIHRALSQRRELLFMSFKNEEDNQAPDMSVVRLDLRSVVCVPLVSVRTGSVDTTAIVTAMSQTVGLLYLDARDVVADLSAGNRELLQTLALEASTILENARLLEAERHKHRIEDELRIARNIQQGLLPRSLPRSGWFRASGSSMPSYQVGGDYFDVRPSAPDAWSAVVADVSGKGVSSALLAALLQGAFCLAQPSPSSMEETVTRINGLLSERAQAEKYATLFYAILTKDGTLHWLNAGHCPPLIIRADGKITTLRAGAMPVGLLDDSQFPAQTTQLQACDKVLIYSDGISDAQNADDQFFGVGRIRDIAGVHGTSSAEELHKALTEAVDQFTEGSPQRDDMTLLVLEYRPE